MLRRINLQANELFKKGYSTRLNDYVLDRSAIDTILFDDREVDGSLLMIQLVSFFESEEFRENKFRNVKTIFGNKVVFCNFDTYKSIMTLVMNDVANKESKHLIVDFNGQTGMCSFEKDEYNARKFENDVHKILCALYLD